MRHRGSRSTNLYEAGNIEDEAPQSRRVKPRITAASNHTQQAPSIESRRITGNKAPNNTHPPEAAFVSR
ncbi:hypothetical protein L484_012257 [Morus notabilis]|uniref:Uncharacterized protein n=1 Tax=Morus notabilis TaxID=981085 RepID=W9RMZ6_9ROSA|nr:hypothetical protein L484_012257 [Morus notabilis]